MFIGVPREDHRHEHRVGLSPSSVARLTRRGHTVHLESGAGDGAHFSDQVYQEVGAQIVYNKEEVYRRADLVCRVGWVSVGELEMVKPGLALCGFHHLAVAPRAKVQRLLEIEATVIGYELIRDRENHLAVLPPMSEMAGQMAVQIAAHYLQTEVGGRGILLGNVPGVPPPTVLILGAGTVGRTAARLALDSGAHVILIDDALDKLRQASHELDGRPVTAMANARNLGRYSVFADVVIGAVLIPGSRAPYLITEDMVKAMKPGSVIIDLSIDQGGCVETSRPTTPENPTFVAHEVIHYCVPNMTANIARTATRALANAAIPFVLEMAEKGVESAIRNNPGLAAGVYVYKGKLVNQQVAEALELPVTEPEELFVEGNGA
jgi:alanine dehydrogenase